jgi:hypothetical protein
VAQAQGMKAKVILNLLLVLAVTAIALYAILRPAEKKDPGIGVFQFKRAEVTRLGIEHRQGAPIRLEKRGDGWHVTAPFAARADVGQVDRVLDLTSATAKQKLPREDLARFGLEPPQVTVTLDDQAIAFGKINEITNEQYAATADAIYLLAPFHGYGIPADAGKLVSRKLLADDEIPVGFEFDGYRILRDDKGHWSATGVLPNKSASGLSQDEFNRWAEEWRVTYALAVEPYKSGAGRQSVTVRLKNGKSVTMQAAEANAGFTLLRNDENLLYRFGAQTGRRLMNPHVAAEK